MDAKEQVKRSVTITDVVSLYVDLKPAGKYLKALCPFHTEKTPSFFVMPDKDIFTCYGCNKFGDIFTFVQEIENLSFPEAMNFLIDKFNIPVDRSQRGGQFKKDVYTKINELAMRYFRENLLDSAEGKKAMEYLTGRGISRKTVELFSLGYAQNQWDGLYGFLRNQSGDIEKAIELGLLIKSHNHRIYDRFRGRIIFPIFPEFDPRIPIAFGGRTIFADPSKYLNSPDTPLYKKSKHLYGFHLSKENIREKKSSILVEGYFDVVSLFQQGIENVVASLGTALTENQVQLLTRFSDKERIYIFYDSDKAGIDATVRGIEMMFRQNINPKIIAVTDDDVKDPDDFVKKKGVKAFYQLVENAIDGFRFLIRQVSQTFDLGVPERKRDAIRAIMNAVEKISDPIIRTDYIRMTADFFNVDEHLLTSRKKNNNPGNEVDSSHKRLGITLAERVFLEDILAVPEFIGSVKELFTKELLSVLVSKNIIRLILGHYNEETREIEAFSSAAEELTDAEKREFRHAFERSKSIKKNQTQVEKEIESCILKFQDIFNKRETRRIDQEIKMAIRANNIEEAQQLIRKKTKYIKSKYNIMNDNSNLTEGAVD
ncbi:MAG: DNA primase [Candidatus Aminicenantes bacterium]|nr:MAG: DNA primase [Candidatus Aminicenantes bacterium]